MSNSKKNIVENISKVGDKIGKNIYLQGISQGVMSILPIIIIGAFASLFAGLPIDAWQDFIGKLGINSLLNLVVNATTNMLGVYFTYSIARSLAEKLEVKSKAVPVLAMVVYLVLLPVTQTETGGSYLAYDFLGTKGMILGILIAIAVVKLYKFFINHKVTIKMPQGTPDYVSNSFSALIPGMIIVVLAMIISSIVRLTSFGDSFNLVYNILQIPLTSLIGGSVLSNAVITGLGQLTWGLGIHPGFIQSMTAPILFGLDGANQAAYATGQAVPNIIGMAFSYITTTAVLYPAIAIAILIFAKSKQLKTVGKISVAPAFFGISEPLIFGLPVVFNPIILIPWICAPIVNFVLGYFLTSIGLVEKCAGVIVFNVPMIITGLMNGSFTISLMEIALFIIDIVLFMPFIKAMDKKYLKEEAAVLQSA